MKLIGITGKARSGKDSAARYLWTQYGFTRIALADPLKAAAQAMFGLSDRQAWDDELKEVEIPFWGMTPRRMLQLLGTDASKPIFGNDIWVKRWLITYDLLNDTDDIVVPDVRVDIEADAIRSRGGIIIEVRRDVAGLPGAAGAHVSEGGLSAPADFVIHNNGTLEELYAALDTIVGGLA